MPISAGSVLAGAVAALEPLADGLLDERRVGLAAGRLHHLADEEAEDRLAGPVVVDRLRVGGARPRRRRRRGPTRRRSGGSPRDSTIDATDDAVGGVRREDLLGVRAGELAARDPADEIGELGRGSTRAGGLADRTSGRPSHAPVTQFATAFGSSVGRGRPSGLEQLAGLRLADEDRGVVGRQSEVVGVAGAPGGRAARAAPSRIEASQAASTRSGGRSGSGK